MPGGKRGLWKKRQIDMKYPKEMEVYGQMTSARHIHPGKMPFLQYRAAGTANMQISISKKNVHLRSEYAAGPRK